jgi:hypothetical protein
MSAPEQSPSAALRRLTNGFQVSQAIYVAATLGIPDLLRDGPRSSADLAAATGSHPGALHRLLRALASVDVLHQDDAGFALTEMGECLRSDAAQPVAGWAALVGRPYFWTAWGALLESVRTGENAMRHVTGMGPWEYRAERPDERAIFDRAMTDLTRRGARALLEAYDFSRFSTVVDVGGGQARFWRRSWRPIPGCTASCSTSRASSRPRTACWRPPAWRTAARSSAATSSRPFPRAATPT